MSGESEPRPEDPLRGPRDHSPVDVLVIGGGVVGASVARDAASRGLNTLLVEQADFASGTSSRSSRLLHGGLRYLAQGRIGLVREASQEKMRLSRIAPHLCLPMPFLFPVWKGQGWSLTLLRIGVRVYDWLCGKSNLGRSSGVSRPELLQVVPGLLSDGLRGATRHYDAFTNDARLVLDTMLTAEAAGADVRNYTRFGSATRADDRWLCTLHAQESGDICNVTARVVVNAAGPWADRFPQSGVTLRLTKGVHLVVEHNRLPVGEAVVLTAGRRILFVIPWGDRVILGTTDTDFEGDPAAVTTEPSDVRYILDVVNRAFPRLKLCDADVIATWAGIRPLVAPRHVEAGAPSDISRSHVIRMPEPGWFDVAGGKLTTCRHMAEQTVDRVGAFLGRRLPASQTATLPLVKGRFSGVLPPPIQREVVEHCCRHEWAIHLDDILMRRTSWLPWHGHSRRPELAIQTADWMAGILNWTDARRQSELERLMN